MENNFQDQNTNQNNYQNGGKNYTQYTRPISRREIGLCILFSLITCGIYGVYWIYCMGEKLDRFNDRDSNSGLLYVLLTIFGLSIVAYCIMQDQVNKHATIA